MSIQALLPFDQTTSRDAKAIAWLMEQGANVSIIAEYVEPGLSPQLQDLFKEALDKLERDNYSRIYAVASVLLQTDKFVGGLATLTARLIDITESDVLLVGHQYQKSDSQKLVVDRANSRLWQKLISISYFKPFVVADIAQAASMSTQTDDAATNISGISYLS